MKITSSVFFTLGCDLLFTGKTADSALSFIPSTGVTNKIIKVPANKTCSFYFGEKLYAHYLDCDGAWKEISSSSVNESLDVTPGWNTSQLQLTVGIKGTESHFMRTHFVTAYAQGVPSCPVTWAKVWRRRVSLVTLTTCGRVQVWPCRKRLGTRLACRKPPYMTFYTTCMTLSRLLFLILRLFVK